MRSVQDHNLASDDAVQAAKDDANRHWAEGDICYLCYGYFHPTGPILDPGRVFYCRPLSPWATPAEVRYCEAYNEEIDNLLRLYGVPEWAPVNRAISEEEALTQLLRKGEPFSASALSSDKVRFWVDRVLERHALCYDRKPNLFCFSDSANLLLVGYLKNVDYYNISVIDVRDSAWMLYFDKVPKCVALRKKIWSEIVDILKLY